MARIVLVRGKGPIPVGDPPVSVCGCGLSKTFPLCSGAHIIVQDEEEGTAYAYDSRGRRIGKVSSIMTEKGEAAPGELYSPG